MSERPVSLLERIQQFLDLLDEEGMAVPASARVDALESVTLSGIESAGALKVALRANVCRSGAEQQRFDELFRKYWLREEAPANQLPEDAERSSEQEAGEGDEGDKGVAASAGHQTGEVNLGLDWVDFDGDLKTAINRLRRLVRSEEGRRWELSRRGRLSLRATLRNYLRHGGEFTHLGSKRRKRSRTRILCLVDMSNSMTSHTRYLIQFVLAMHRAVPGTRSVFFSSRAIDMSPAIAREDDQAVLERIGGEFPYWASGTDIGGALAYLNRELLTGSSRRPTVVIVSDGFDQGDPEQLTAELERLRRRSERLVWINPLLHTSGYEPRARGMRLALPFIDHFLAAFDGPSLLRAVARIATAARISSA